MLFTGWSIHLHHGRLLRRYFHLLRANDHRNLSRDVVVRVEEHLPRHRVHVEEKTRTVLAHLLGRHNPRGTHHRLRVLRRNSRGTNIRRPVVPVPRDKYDLSLNLSCIYTLVFQYGVGYCSAWASSNPSSGGRSKSSKTLEKSRFPRYHFSLKPYAM